MVSPARDAMSRCTRSANACAVSPGARVWGSRNQTSHTTAQERIRVARWAVKDWRLEFQNASTNTRSYRMATGQTTAPRSNAPRLNITQYRLLTHVPSGKMRSGVCPGAATCARMRSATSARSRTSVRLNQRHPRQLRTEEKVGVGGQNCLFGPRRAAPPPPASRLPCVWRKPTQPGCSCMMTAKGEQAHRMM